IALSYQRLISECSLKQEELGDRVGKNRSTVTNYLRLLRLPPDIQIALRDNVLTMGHARAIITVEDPAKQLWLFKRIVNEDLSVRKVEALVRELHGGTSPTPSTPSASPVSRDISQLQAKLSSHFGTKVNIKGEGQRGEIRIPYISVQDLNRILEILKME
ncbi:MAG: ParB/RepB/Spo0J family partition protein, partial [Bacteroidota bacterium]